MSWALAFTIIGVSFVLFAFLLFMIVYLKELRREKTIMKEYLDSYSKAPLQYVELPLVLVDPQKPTTPKPDPNKTNDKGKKNFN